MLIEGLELTFVIKFNRYYIFESSIIFKLLTIKAHFKFVYYSIPSNP